MMEPYAHRAADTLLPQVTGEHQRLSGIDEDAVLGNPDGARHVARRLDLLGDGPAHRLLAVQRIRGPIHLAAGIPRILAEVGLADKRDLVRAEPLEAAVVEL